MKIYTKTGDDGTTGLYGGERVLKDSLRVDCYGTVDELNSLLGLAETEIKDVALQKIIHEIQNELFTLGGELATPKKKVGMNIVQIRENDINFLEHKIDEYEEKLEPLKQFILPGGSKGASLLHYSRSVCRRAERLVTSLSQKEEMSNLVLIYLNRLSDLLFVLARFENNVNQIPDIPWQK